MSAASVGRLPGLDLARGIAILAMIAFHFCFDLSYWQLASFNMLGDWRWIWSRNLIVTAFLAIMGISLVLGHDHSAHRFWRRLALLGAAALAISLISWLMFGERFIYFGVLHFALVASVLGRGLLFLPRRPWLWGLAGLLCLLAGLAPGFAAMEPRWLNWLGLAAVKPATEDYVPLLPWFGVVLWGMVAGAWLAARSGAGIRPSSLPGRLLVWLGRHSLLIYLLHQPLLMAGFWLLLN